MPSLKDIRKRIGTVKNTQKITRAMKLVAAAKLRRAQEAIIAARPYSKSLEELVSELADVIGSDIDAVMEKANEAERKAYGLLKDRPDPKTAVVILLTSDRGLAGAFNAQLIKGVERFVDRELSDFETVSLRLAGRKGNDYFKRRKANILSYDPAPTSPSALGLSRELANHAVDDYTSMKADRVFVVYNEFRSAVSQEVVVRQLLPIVPPQDLQQDLADVGEQIADIAYEPSKEKLLVHLLPLYIQNQLFRGCLESVASELGARMSAMDSATNNAGDMISRLTLQYNRARQAAITKELLEIISGAESLKG